MSALTTAQAEEACRRGYRHAFVNGAAAMPYEDWRRAFLAGIQAVETERAGQLYVLDMAGQACTHLPDGFELRLCMEQGAAWVELLNPDSDSVALPDAADKCLETQVNDAITMAKGF